MSEQKAFNSRPRVLIIKLGALGDIIMASPMITHFQKQGFEIHWLAGTSMRPLLEEINGIDRILTLDDRKLLAGSKIEKVFEVLKFRLKTKLDTYDKIVLAHSDARYKILTWGAKAMTGFKSNLLRHFTYEYLRFASDSQDSETPPVEYPSLKIGAWWGQRSKEIVLAPGGAKNILADDRARRWPSPKFAEAASQLISMGYEITLCGAAADEWVLPDFKAIPHKNLIGKTHMKNLLLLFQQARLVITNDSGPLHLAGLVGTPTVGVFGATQPHLLLTIDRPMVSVRLAKLRPCQPCFNGKGFAACKNFECLGDLPVKDVVQASLDLLVQTEMI